MKSLLTLFLITLSLVKVAQITPNPRGFTSMNLGNTQAADVVEVNDGYVTSITTNVHSINSATYLVKFDFDLNFVDSVKLPYSISYVTESPSLKIIGDSLYVHYYYYTPNANVFYDDLMTYDFDLNLGNTYSLPTDSIGLTFLLTLKNDSTFIAAGSKLGTWNYLSVIEFDLAGNIVNRVDFNDTNYIPFVFALSVLPLNNNRVLVTTGTDSYILNLHTNNIDTAYNQIFVPEINSSRYIDIAHHLSFKNYGILGGTPQTPMVLTEIGHDGSLGNPFLLDSTMLFQFNSDSSYGFGIVRGLAEDLDGNIYAISRYERRKRFDWRPQNDSLFGSIFVHKFNADTREILWKREINIYKIKGGSLPPFATSIQTTSDGGCVGVFNSNSLDSLRNPSGTIGFIFKLGPNGELLSQTSFEAPKPQISIYPNPAKESLFINSHQTAVEITINDVSGRLVYQSPSRQFQHQVDVQEWPSGMYVVQMTGKDGKRWTEKVLVE